MEHCYISSVTVFHLIWNGVPSYPESRSILSGIAFHLIWNLLDSDKRRYKGLFGVLR